jgi:hypothetical protein
MFIELHNFGQLRSSSLWARGDTKLGQSGFERAAFTTLKRPCQTRACFARKEKNSLTTIALSKLCLELLASARYNRELDFSIKQ